MLIEFTVKNFRSIRDEQTLSFYAQNQLEHFASSIHYPASNKVGVLASAGVYGANASGKTTLMQALKVFFEFVEDSHQLQEDDEIDAYQPYRLLEAMKSAGSEFAVEFVVEGVRYVYQLELNATRVVSERLDFYSQGASREVRSKLFEHAKDTSWEDMTFGTHFKGGTRKFPLFPNQAYLSKAGNSPDAPEMIRKVYQFFRRDLVFAAKGMKVMPSWRKDEALVQQVSRFLSAVDTGISSVVIKKESRDDLVEHLPAGMPEAIKSRILDDFSLVPYFQHATEDGGVELFAEADESDGTRALFHVLPMLLHVFEQGKVLIWDELESSLHPHVSELVLDLFNDQDVNKNHAQLLFTTHNLELMNSQKMRKDQLWLTEKREGATSLVSLDEFDSALKPTSPFAKWYDEGRLGGVPGINYALIATMFTEASVSKDA